MFRTRAAKLASGINFTTGLAFWPALYFTAAFLQYVRGVDPGVAGRLRRAVHGRRGRRQPDLRSPDRDRRGTTASGRSPAVVCAHRRWGDPRAVARADTLARVHDDRRGDPRLRHRLHDADGAARRAERGGAARHRRRHVHHRSSPDRSGGAIALAALGGVLNNRLAHWIPRLTPSDAGLNLEKLRGSPEAIRELAPRVSPTA